LRANTAAPRPTHRPPRRADQREGKQLIDQIADMGVPIFVFTGAIR